MAQSKETPPGPSPNSPSLLFEYQCRSGKFIRLANRIESKLFLPELECSTRQITTPAPHHSVFLHAGCPSCRPTNRVKALKAFFFHLTEITSRPTSTATTVASTSASSVTTPTVASDYILQTSTENSGEL